MGDPLPIKAEENDTAQRQVLFKKRVFTRPSFKAEANDTAQRTVRFKKRVFTEAESKPQVQAARWRFSQKKRSSDTDARDVLHKIAKRRDARNKLNELRATPLENIKAIGRNITQRTDCHGKISLVTNKTKVTNVVTKPEETVISWEPPTASASHTPRQVDLKEVDPPTYNPQGRNFELPVHPWSQPGLSIAAQPINSLESCTGGVDPWQNFPVNTPLQLPQNYNSLDAVHDGETPPAPLKQTMLVEQGCSRIPNVHMRLDESPEEQEYHGNFEQPKTEVSVPVGHKIIVSNLEPSVTQDDVEELFGEMGYIVSARLVGPGVAEIIYKMLQDAQNAVENFDDRRLDGEPIKCLLVTDDEEIPLTPSKQTISSQGSSRIPNVHMRLDESPEEQENYEIFEQPKTEVFVPAGYRIVASNLDPSVTQDDVEELFGEIGQLLSARLVRPGIAEVIYKNLQEAQNAVNNYDNRSLDGQRMKCQLVTDDEEMPVSPMKRKISLQGSSRKTNVCMRLDGSPEQKTHLIFRQLKTKVVHPPRYRIIVSNLKPSVTQDDVIELFEEIGQLLSARLVRPGVAEVIYENLHEAQNAVNVYHNRLLDGQPMKCRLVKRSLINPMASSLGKLLLQG